MSYVGKMSDLIELYLAELERDGLDNVLGVGLPVVSGILTDFAQWLEDDVTEELSAIDREEYHQQLDLNLTGFGAIVEDELNEELNATANYTEVADWAAKRRQYLHRLRADSAMGYLRALNAGEDSDIE